MKMTALLRSFWVIGGIVIIAVVVNLCFYSVAEHEQIILTQFGRPVGQPVRAGRLSLQGSRSSRQSIASTNAFWNGMAAPAKCPPATSFTWWSTPSGDGR